MATHAQAALAGLGMAVMDEQACTRGAGRCGAWCKWENSQDVRGREEENGHRLSIPLRRRRRVDLRPLRLRLREARLVGCPRR
jgi:hypothetical protein